MPKLTDFTLARRDLDTLREVGVVTRWSEPSSLTGTSLSPRFTVTLSGRRTEIWSARDVRMFKAGCDAGIDRMREMGLLE